MNANFFEMLFSSPEADLFTPLDLLLAMSVSALLGLVLTSIYRYTHRGTSYSQSFLVTMIIMAVATSVVMMIIGSNIARAFSLVGALSIIRFRTAVKDARDTSYLFASMIEGMGCGTGFYLASISMTFFISGLMLLLYWMDFGIKQKLECIIRVTYVDSAGTLERIEAAVGGAFREFRLINRVLSFENGEQTNVYVVKPRDASESEIEQRLSEIEGVRNLYVYQSDQHAPF